MTNPPVVISTALRNYNALNQSELSLRAICAAHGLPSTMFQPYGLRNGSYSPIPIDRVLGSLTEFDKVILQCNRNPDLRQYQQIGSTNLHNSTSSISIASVKESEDQSSFVPIAVEFTELEARDTVADIVFSQLEDLCPSGTIFAGLSGGGDSNAMAPGLKKWEASAPDRHVTVFTLEFEDIWPSGGTDRARELCKRYNFEHVVMDASDIERVLRIKTSLFDFFFDWTQLVGTNTTHQFATYLISTVARAWLRENINGNKFYAVGYNREDVLGDVLYSLINGEKPLEYPVRHYGDVSSVMPTWTIPKALLDGCFLEFSAENYSERIDGTVKSRALTHHLAHSLDSIYPNFGLSLLTGVRDAFGKGCAQLSEKGFDLWASPYATDEATEKMLQLCMKHLESS